MSRRLYFLLANNDIYHKALAEAVTDELKEIYSDLEFGYVLNIKDIFKADIIVICGEGEFPKKILLAISFLRKPLVLYHVSNKAKYLQKFASQAKWIVVSRRGEKNYGYYSSPIFLSDLATPKRINRIWSKEKLVSKRGCIGLIGLDLEEGLQKKLAVVLDLLVEDLDLNIIFIPILEKDYTLHQEILSQIKFSANTRYIKTKQYSSREVLGIISKVDILITSDFRGAICAMASNRPVVGLNPDESLTELLGESVEEEILLDINTLPRDEIYTKIKIAWVHREAIIEQMQGRINEMKAGATEGIRQLGKRIFKIVK